MSRRRWLILSLAALVLATSGSVAGLAAGNAEVPAPFPNTIVALHSNKCLTASSGIGPVLQQSCATATASRQAFRLTPVSGETYTITPIDGAGCVGVRVGATANGTPVELSTACTGGAEQKFTRTKVADGAYSLKNEYTGKALNETFRDSNARSAVIAKFSL